MPSPFYPQEAEGKKGSKADTEVGLVIGSLQLSGLVGSVIVGTYMSRFDVKLLMICGVFVVGGSTVIFGAVGSIDNW